MAITGRERAEGAELVVLETKNIVPVAGETGSADCRSVARSAITMSKLSLTMDLSPINLPSVQWSSLNTNLQQFQDQLQSIIAVTAKSHFTHQSAQMRSLHNGAFLFDHPPRSALVDNA
ncbi:hypothetical protein PSTG_11143 [Puccinia striiformis f. sp. tritici PST-78]|uniref:Uncharacterized protein n=1 Tax=Puccinia striiformis f. sp. tritici PST-78 TaxID=1165861 RepID=A0A0L0V8D2_9BASI|nr:hypothetical protein PSTG_11143 [Puccinia striiformis f. sp. tritici PST-78]